MAEPESEWEREQRFWREHPIDRFDLEECGSGYMSYRDMRLNETGDWIRAEDHRKVVSELAALLEDVRNAAVAACCVGDSPKHSLHEVRQAMKELRAHLSSQHAAPEPPKTQIIDLFDALKRSLEDASREDKL